MINNRVSGGSECQVEAESIDSRHRIAAVIYAKGDSRTSQFRSVTGVMFPGFQVLDIYIKLQCLHADFGD